MSYEAYEKHQYETGVALRLRETEVEAAVTKERFTHSEVMANLRTRISGTAGE